MNRRKKITQHGDFIRRIDRGNARLGDKYREEDRRRFFLWSQLSSWYDSPVEIWPVYSVFDLVIIPIIHM